MDLLKELTHKRQTCIQFATWIPFKMTSFNVIAGITNHTAL